MTSQLIGTLQETSLHANLKSYYARPGDEVEGCVDGYWVDIVRGEQLIEIQTGNFSALKRKLGELLAKHRVRVVYPIAQEKYIIRIAKDGDQVLSRRRSPKHGQAIHLFDQLVYIAALATSPNFSLELLLVSQEDLWQDDGKGSWRRKGWSIVDRRLLAVRQSLSFETPQDYRLFLPPTLPPQFTGRDLAHTAGIPTRLAGKMVYSLAKMGVIDQAVKFGRAKSYTRAVAANRGVTRGGRFVF